MSIDVILLAATSVGLTLGVALWIAWPLVRGEVPADPPDARAVALLSRREASLATLRDLDSDYADGKLAEDDYKESRERTIGEGATALAALDRLNDDLSGRADALADLVESDVAAARGDVGRTEVAAGVAAARGDVDGPDLDAGVTDTQAADVPAAELFCTHCGKRARPGDGFCAGCGEALDSAPGTSQ